MRRLAVFASGSGTNFEAIVRACEQGVLDAEVMLMVCDKPGAKVVERAAEHGVEAFVFAPKEYASKAAYEREIVARLDAAGVELVCLAGYMRIIGDELLGAYGGRIINIHPSLLPAFRGAHAIEHVEYCVYWLENGEPMHEVFSSLAAAEMYSCAIRGKENIEWVEVSEEETIDLDELEDMFPDDFCGV